MGNNRYSGKIKFVGKRFDSFSNKDILSFQAMCGRGIYIFLSPNKNIAYVGKSTNIVERLKVHIRGTFILKSYIDSTSYIVLQEDDVEMYCCFTEDVYRYNSNVELDIFEGIVMDAVINSGYKLVNQNIPNYNLDDIENENFSIYTEEIQLSDNMFRFGLRDILKDKMMYCNMGYKGEMDAIKQERDKAFSKLKEAEEKNKKLIMERNRLSNDIKLLTSKIKNLESNIDSLNKKCININNKYKNACSDIEIQKEYYMNRELKNEEYLREFKEKVINDNKEMFKNHIKLIIGVGFANSEYEQFLITLGFGEFIKKVASHKSCKKYRMMIKEIINDSSFVVNKIDYSKIFIEYGVLEYMQKRTYTMLIYYFRYNNTINTEEKESIIDEYSKLLHDETCKLFDNFKRVSIK